MRVIPFVIAEQFAWQVPVVKLKKKKSRQTQEYLLPFTLRLRLFGKDEQLTSQEKLSNDQK